VLHRRLATDVRVRPGAQATRQLGADVQRDVGLYPSILEFFFFEFGNENSHKLSTYIKIRIAARHFNSETPRGKPRGVSLLKMSSLWSSLFILFFY
ncbi:MAG: hypothetical protein ACLQBQ_00665, partial [Smithella sp.]